MINPQPPEKSGVCPYATDIEYLLAEVDWVGVRYKRIQLQRDLAERDEVVPRPGFRHKHAVSLVASADRLESMLQEEQVLRQEIDAKLALNRSTGPGLGLDRLCHEHNLNDFERQILLQGFIPCLGEHASSESISRSDSVMVTGSIYFEGVSSFLELRPPEHLKSLLCLLPSGPLLGHGLVRFSYETRSLSDVVSAGIEVTGPTLAAITGIPGLKGFCESCLKGDKD